MFVYRPNCYSLENYLLITYTCSYDIEVGCKCFDRNLWVKNAMKFVNSIYAVYIGLNELLRSNIVWQVSFLAQCIIGVQCMKVVK